MRPLAVLALVVAAVAALAFAYVSITGVSDGPREGAVAREKVVKPAETEPRRNGAEIAAPAVAEVPVDRTEVAPATAVPQDSGAGWQNSLSGTIQSPTRQPVEGARVSVFRHKAPEHLAALAVMFDQGGGQPEKALRTTRTDETGRYEFQGLPPGLENMIVVEHESYQRAEVVGVAIPEKGDVREDVTLEEGLKILGYVRDTTTGRPIPGAKLWLDNPLSAQLPASRPSPDRMYADSDETGRYQFNHVGPGTKWLVCTAAGYGTVMHSNIAVASPERHLTLDVGMQPEKLITGRVLGPDRAGLAGATVDAMSYNAETLSRGSAQSGENGEFVLHGLAEAEYSITARAPGYGEQRKIRVAAGTQNLEIELFELGGVTGRVVDGKSGRALASFQASARMVNQTGTFVGRTIASANVRGAENGAFHLSGLPEGTYVVQVTAEGYADSRSETFQVGQGLTVPDIVVQMGRGGTVKGRVVDGYTNEPLAGAVVGTQDNRWVDSPFTKTFQGLVPRNTTVAQVRTDKDGTFALELLTPTEYQINVVHPKYTAETMNDVRVFENQDNDLGTIKLYSGARVTGQVFLGNGAKALGATVSLHPADGNSMRNYEARTNSEGRYQFQNVAPGSYRLSAARQKQDANPFVVIVDMKQSEREITLVDGREYTQDLYLGSD